MRNVTQQIASMLYARSAGAVSNSTVINEGGTGKLYLHGNLIAEWDGSKLRLLDAGWQSNTTKERLNGILEVFGFGERVVQRNFEWHVMLGDNLTSWEGEIILEVSRG